jgi:hypothetical protein
VSSSQPSAHEALISSYVHIPALHMPVGSNVVDVSASKQKATGGELHASGSPVH